jgi:hypothetical protein
VDVAVYLQQHEDHLTSHMVHLQPCSIGGHIPILLEGKIIQTFQIAPVSWLARERDPTANG